MGMKERFNRLRGSLSVLKIYTPAILLGFFMGVLTASFYMMFVENYPLPALTTILTLVVFAQMTLLEKARKRSQK